MPLESYLPSPLLDNDTAERLDHAERVAAEHLLHRLIHLRALALSDLWDRAMALTLQPPKPRIPRMA